MMNIDKWNVLENNKWFVILKDNGTNPAIELYLTHADALAQTNKQADGEAIAYGNDQKIVLVNDPSATIPVNFFDSTYPWHVSVTVNSGDGSKIICIGKFTDLPDVNDPVYRSTALINRRATKEINAHTHLSTLSNIPLSKPNLILNPGEVININSDRLGTNMDSQINSISISGTFNGLNAVITNTITTKKYKAMTR